MLAGYSLIVLIALGAIDKNNPKPVFNWLALGSLITLFWGLPL